MITYRLGGSDLDVDACIDVYRSSTALALGLIMVALEHELRLRPRRRPKPAKTARES